MQWAASVGWLVAGAAALLWAGTAAAPPFDLEHLREGHFATASPPAGRSLKIVNWNIARGVELDKLTRFLEKAAPDLAVLQEVDVNARRSAKQDVAEVLAHKLKLDYAFGPAFEELTQGKKDDPAIQGQATLSRFPIKASRVIRFTAQSTFWEPKVYVPKLPLFQRRHGGRVALVTELDIGGRTMVVYNLHLESRSGGYLQDKQLNETLADMKQYPAGTPILLVGDLNSKYNPRTVLRHLKQEGFASCFGDRMVRSHVLVGWLDWIFVRGPVTCEDAQVHHNATGSDHFPLTARVIWRE